MMKDQIFQDLDSGTVPFAFNESVAAVFPDMLRRSIPGYDATIEAIAALARRYVTAGTRCYDLGCSLGAATLAVRRNICVADCEIRAIDLAPAMVARCRKLVDEDRGTTSVIVAEADVRDTEISNASMVLMNYTLQFLPLRDRPALLSRIHDGMVDGGVFVLSEKVANDDPGLEQLLVELHHDFKRANAYSDLEIARKRSALENVLVPETTATHLERLATAGFRHCGVWLRYFNFISILAIR